MSFNASSDRIYVTDKDGNITFDTRFRFAYFHSTVSREFTVPAIPPNTDLTTVYEQIATIPYPADFVICSRNLNGSYISASSTYPTGSRIFAVHCFRFYMDGNKIMCKRTFGNKGGSQNSFTYRLHFFCGNYDL
jgi:hypothetical protein